MSDQDRRDSRPRPPFAGGPRSDSSRPRAGAARPRAQGESGVWRAPDAQREAPAEGRARPPRRDGDAPAPRIYRREHESGADTAGRGRDGAGPRGPRRDGPAPAGDAARRGYAARDGGPSRGARDGDRGPRGPRSDAPPRSRPERSSGEAWSRPPRDARPPRNRSESSPWGASEPRPRTRERSEDALGTDFDRSLQRAEEVRIFGRAACLAVAAQRLDGVRKVYFEPSLRDLLAPYLGPLSAARVGYREVPAEDLARLTGSQHHEGLVFEIQRLRQPSYQAWLEERDLHPPSRELVLVLEGVANPHNFGAILRTAAHFGAAAVFLPKSSPLTLSGAVYRVAEGAAELTPVIRYPDTAALSELRERGYSLVASAADAPDDAFRCDWPARSALLLGAEGSGLSDTAQAMASRRVRIPGSGRVESLNVGQAASLLMAEWWRRHGA